MVYFVNIIWQMKFELWSLNLPLNCWLLITNLQLFGKCDALFHFMVDDLVVKSMFHVFCNSICFYEYICINICNIYYVKKCSWNVPFPEAFENCIPCFSLLTVLACSLNVLWYLLTTIIYIIEEVFLAINFDILQLYKYEGLTLINIDIPTYIW